MSHRRSCQCTTWTLMNNNCHTTLIHATNSIALHSDWLHMVEIMEIFYGKSWKLRRRSWIWKGKAVRLYISKLIDGCICYKVQAESAQTRWAMDIHLTDNMYSGGSETQSPQFFLIKITIHRNHIMSVNNDYMHFGYNCWSSNDSEYVLKVSVNIGWMILV